MKILIISEVPTHPVRAGNRMWILGQTKLLEQLGHEVHFLYVKNDFPGKSDYEETKAYWGDRFHYFHKSILYKWRLLIINKYRRKLCKGYWKCDDRYVPFLHYKVNKLIETHGFDTCVVNYYYLTKLFTKINVPVKALFTHDCFTHKSLVTGFKKAESLTPREEAKAMMRSPHIFALQDEEAIYFRELSPRSCVYNVYGAFNFTDLPVAGNKNILFLSGSFRYNVEGLKWFIDKIFPLIVDKHPDVKLIIGGAICSVAKHLSNNANIQLYGYVEDVKSFYALGDVVINPVFNGTGLKIKTFEAISYGKTVIAHPHSTEGIFDRDNAPMLYSEKPDEWVEYMDLVFADIAVATKYKEKDKDYLTRMNAHIVEQYALFLENKSIYG